jgi:hypothetical protein
VSKILYSSSRSNESTGCPEIVFYREGPSFGILRELESSARKTSHGVEKRSVEMKMCKKYFAM